MSNQNTQKKVHSEDEIDPNKFKDIEEAIQKAIKTESSKQQKHADVTKASTAK